MFKILSVGRICFEKDYPTLIKTAENLKIDYEWNVIGGGDDKLLRKYKEMSKDLNINWLGGKHHDEVLLYYRKADAFVLSSSSESFGKVLVEAMINYLPVISTATMGGKEILSCKELGILVPIGDYKTIARAIEYLNRRDPIYDLPYEILAHEIVKDKYCDNTKKIIQFWKDIKNS